MRRCSKCLQYKSKINFYKRKDSGDGFRKECKSCIKLLRKKHYQTNRLDILITNKIYTQQNRGVSQKASAKYYRNNKAYYACAVRKRQSIKLKRSVAWSNQDLVVEKYLLAKALTKWSGVLHHVDHIIPLQGRLVSGLHWEENLQVIPWYENLKKSNNYSV